MPGKSFYETLNKNKTFDRTVSTEAYGDDTVKLIVKTINTYALSDFVKSCVEILSRGNPSDFEFCRKLFEVACKNVTYLADTPGHEVIYTPLLLMRMGQGDCKKYTVFIGAVLKRKGIDGIPKVVNYECEKDWQHIYIISRLPGGSYITLDPVNHCRFNKEVNYCKARLNYLDGTYSEIMPGNKLSQMGNLGQEPIPGFLMGIGQTSDSILADLESITGVGDNANKFDSVGLAGLEEVYISGPDDVDSMGKKRPKSPVAQKAATEKKAKKKKVFKAAKKLGFQPMRVGFLALIRMAGALSKTPLKINLASKMAISWKKDNGKAITQLWEKFGGKREALRSALSKAANTQLNGISQEGFDISGIGVVTAAAAAALIASATPILKGVFDLIKKQNVVSTEEGDILLKTADTIEDVATTAEGAIKPELIEEVKYKNTRVVQEAAKDDGGGNITTQKEIIKEAVKEEQGIDPSKTPAPTGLSMASNIYLPTTWFKIFFIAIAFTNIFSIPALLQNISGIVIGAGLILTTIHLFTHKKNNNGKI